MTFTAFLSTDDVSAVRMNLFGNEIQDQIDDILDGTSTIVLNASDFTNAQHDHSSAGEGGKVAESAVSVSGGAAGQVLTVNAGGTASEWADTPTTALTTKGDLLTKNAAGDLVRVAVGTNEHVLVADSAQTAGMKWAGRVRMATGTYTGDAAATKAITGLGFQPEFVMIYLQFATTSRMVFKSDQDGTGAYNLTNGFANDHIVSLDADGFTVGDGTGTSNQFNVNASVYSYIAWRND